MKIFKKLLKKKNRKYAIFAAAILILVLVSGALLAGRSYYRTWYTAKELGIPEIKSENDQDSDGVDDYTDMLLGARSYIATKPEYKSEYYEGGYPDDGKGVCTDVVWHAFAAAGYDLKSMVDSDIAENIEEYPDITTPDPNIDFRRVVNLNVFFERHAVSLPLDFSHPEDWQAGDIVVFPHHIAVCSDRRTREGIPFIIHHGSTIEGPCEVNAMARYEVIGHYRWQ